MKKQRDITCIHVLDRLWKYCLEGKMTEISGTVYLSRWGVAGESLEVLLKRFLEIMWASKKKKKIFSGEFSAIEIDHRIKACLVEVHYVRVYREGGERLVGELERWLMSEARSRAALKT